MTDLGVQVREAVQRRRWLKPGERLGIAVSGGADSVALLRLMLELRGDLGVVLSVVHLNHTLRGDESEADHGFVRDLAREHGLEFHEARGDVAMRAREESLSIEAAAREARYELFWGLIEGGSVDKVATAHTLDDQAETVLLRLIRGTGIRGLSGIHPELTALPDGRESRGRVIRPLLEVRRQEVAAYLAGLGQVWREDSSNADLRHTRNRVRQKLIPLLEGEFNPEAAERLADLAEVARGEEAYWQGALAQLSENKYLTVMGLAGLPLAVRRRVLKAAAPPGLALDFGHVEAVLRVAVGTEDAPPACNLPRGWTFEREGDSLAFVEPKAQGGAPGASGGVLLEGGGYLRLPVPGRVDVPGTAKAFRARRIGLGSGAEGYNRQHLYAVDALPSELIVRTWQFGDRFWPAHTKAPKKLKELFQEKQIAAASRAAWPVMLAVAGGNEEVVWVQGFPAPARLKPRAEDREAILLEEVGPA